MQVQPKSWQKRMKGESSKMYDRFREFLKIPPRSRSLKELEKRLNNKESIKNGTEKPIPLGTLEQNSSKWFWKERAKLHDIEKAIQDEENSETEYAETNNKVKNRLVEMLDFAHDLFYKIKENDNDYALTTIVKLFKDLTDIIDKLYLDYRLACGRSTNNNYNENKNETKIDLLAQLELESDISVETIFDKVDKELGLDDD